MTAYSIKLRDVIKFAGDDFMQHYPIFDESHRAELNQKIKDEYWMMEIEHETDALFRHRFKTIMNREMPYYNELYRVAQRKIDPFITMSLKTTSESETTSERDTTSETATTSNTNTTSTNDSTTTAVTDSTAEGRTIGYQFPANMLQQRQDYANSAGDSDSTTQNNTNSTDSSTSDVTGSDTGTSSGTGRETAKGNDAGVSITEGYQGVPGDLLRNYMDNIMNIDDMIVKRLSVLFAKIWATNAPLV